MKKQNISKPESIKNDPARRRKFNYWIGIDPGTNTGIAIFSRLEPLLNGTHFNCDTIFIHQAIDLIRTWGKVVGKSDLFIRVEDPRQIGGSSDIARNIAKMQGAGSIKRDASIWEDFLTDEGFNFEMVRPVPAATKWDMKRFRMLTKFEGNCSNHARDAAILIYGM